MSEHEKLQRILENIMLQKKPAYSKDGYEVAPLDFKSPDDSVLKTLLSCGFQDTSSHAVYSERYWFLFNNDALKKFQIAVRLSA